MSDEFEKGGSARNISCIFRMPRKSVAMLSFFLVVFNIMFPSGVQS